MNKESAGSYDFTAFHEGELERLKAQASIALDLESALWRTMPITPRSRILDLASGPGRTSVELAKLVPEGSVLGVELNSELLQQAQELLAAENASNVQFVQGDVYDLQLAPDSADFAYARFLFQHLAHPRKALESIQRTLAPGGTLCIIDVDDAWLQVHPAPARFAEFVRLAGEAQAANGGDRFVGRKLFTYMAECGYTDLDVQVVPFGSHMVGMQPFLDITTGFKILQLPEAQLEQGQDCLQDIYHACNNPQALGIAGIFVVTGRRPTDAS